MTPEQRERIRQEAIRVGRDQARLFANAVCHYVEGIESAIGRDLPDGDLDDLVIYVERQIVKAYGDEPAASSPAR